MKSLYKLVFIMLWSLFIMIKNTYGYETNVHERIAKEAFSLSQVEQYFTNSLNVNLGITEFNGKFSKQWVADGSITEDKTVDLPPFRYLNHFYDPVTGAGLLGFPSSLQWANSNSSNEWNWTKARGYFKHALTGETAAIREAGYADTFRAVGQIVHLLQDKAVPAHVRTEIAPGFLNIRLLW